MQHHRLESTRHKACDAEAKMPIDEQLEWVDCVYTVFEKKLRWIRAETVESFAFDALQPFGSDEFRLQSTYERKVGLLGKDFGHEIDQHSFEMGAIAATMLYFKDAKLLMDRIEAVTNQARYGQQSNICI